MGSFHTIFCFVRASSSTSRSKFDSGYGLVDQGKLFYSMLLQILLSSNISRARPSINYGSTHPTIRLPGLEVAATTSSNLERYKTACTFSFVLWFPLCFRISARPTPTQAIFEMGRRENDYIGRIPNLKYLLTATLKTDAKYLAKSVQ